MILVYKNKGNIQNYNYYRGIKLLCHTMKVWEWVVEMRIGRGMTYPRINLASCLVIYYKSNQYGEDTNGSIPKKKEGLTYDVYWH